VVKVKRDEIEDVNLSAYPPKSSDAFIIVSENPLNISLAS